MLLLLLLLLQLGYPRLEACVAKDLGVDSILITWLRRGQGHCGVEQSSNTCDSRTRQGVASRIQWQKVAADRHMAFVICIRNAGEPSSASFKGSPHRQSTCVRACAACRSSSRQGEAFRNATNEISINREETGPLRISGVVGGGGLYPRYSQVRGGPAGASTVPAQRGLTQDGCAKGDVSSRRRF
jgi:hypothetical protein